MVYIRSTKNSFALYGTARATLTRAPRQFLTAQDEKLVIFYSRRAGRNGRFRLGDDFSQRAVRTRFQPAAQGNAAHRTPSR